MHSLNMIMEWFVCGVGQELSAHCDTEVSIKLTGVYSYSWRHIQWSCTCLDVECFFTSEAFSKVLVLRIFSCIDNPIFFLHFRTLKHDLEQRGLSDNRYLHISNRISWNTSLDPKQFKLLIREQDMNVWEEYKSLPTAEYVHEFMARHLANARQGWGLLAKTLLHNIFHETKIKR